MKKILLPILLVIALHSVGFAQKTINDPNVEIREAKNFLREISQTGFQAHASYLPGYGTNLDPRRPARQERGPPAASRPDRPARHDPDDKPRDCRQRHGHHDRAASALLIHAHPRKRKKPPRVVPGDRVFKTVKIETAR